MEYDKMFVVNKNRENKVLENENPNGLFGRAIRYFAIALNTFIINHYSESFRLRRFSAMRSLTIVLSSSRMQIRAMY